MSEENQNPDGFTPHYISKLGFVKMVKQFEIYIYFFFFYI